MSYVHLYLVVLMMATVLVYGETRELVPLEAPSNLTLLAIRGHQALIEWEPVEPKSVRGSFRGYLVRTWSHAGSQVYVQPPNQTRANVDFFPYTKNFITVSVRNDRYVGAPSEAISFDAPQIAPTPPPSFDLFTLSNRSVLLRWKRPIQPNGVLLGYKIYCSEIDYNGGVLEEKTRHQISHRIDDPDKYQAKLTGLQEGVRYKFGIAALNCAGESDVTDLEATLDPHTPAQPFIPNFVYKINYTLATEAELCSISPITQQYPEDMEEEEPSTKQPLEYDYYDYHVVNSNETQKTHQSKTVMNEDNKSPVITKKQPEMEYEKRCLVNCMILWLPDVKNQPGEYFYVKYRIKGEQEFQETEPEMSEDFVIIQKFDACRNYEIILTAVDGDHSTDSTILVTPTKII